MVYLAERETMMERRRCRSSPLNVIGAVARVWLGVQFARGSPQGGFTVLEAASVT